MKKFLPYYPFPIYLAVWITIALLHVHRVAATVAPVPVKGGSILVGSTRVPRVAAGVAPAAARPLLTNNINALRIHTNAPPPVPPPASFTFKSSPPDSHVFWSQDLQHWTDTGTNAITVTNSGNGFARGGLRPTTIFNWTPSNTNDTFTLVQTSDGFPHGAFLTIPVPATNTATVPLFGSADVFYLCENAGWGGISQFAPPVTQVVTNPTIIMQAITNHP